MFGFVSTGVTFYTGFASTCIFALGGGQTLFGLTTGASTTDEFPTVDDYFSVFGGGHTEFFFTSGAETDGLELY